MHACARFVTMVCGSSNNGPPNASSHAISHTHPDVSTCHSATNNTASYHICPFTCSHTHPNAISNSSANHLCTFSNSHNSCTDI